MYFQPELKYMLPISRLLAIFCNFTNASEQLHSCNCSLIHQQPALLFTFDVTVLCYVGTYVVLIFFVTIASEVTLYSHLQSVFTGYCLFVITSLHYMLS
jgi:hypothetical protein